MVILSNGKPIQLISPSKAIWDEWALTFRYKPNISRMLGIYEKLCLVFQIVCILWYLYTSLLHGLLNQLELY